MRSLFGHEFHQSIEQFQRRLVVAALNGSLQHRRDLARLLRPGQRVGIHLLGLFFAPGSLQFGRDQFERRADAPVVLVEFRQRSRFLRDGDDVFQLVLVERCELDAVAVEVGLFIGSVSRRNFIRIGLGDDRVPLGGTALRQ